MRGMSLTILAVSCLAVEYAAKALAADPPKVTAQSRGTIPAPAVAPFNAQEAKEFQRQWANHIGKETVFTNSIGMKMMLIPPGEFIMGNDEAGYKLAIKGMLKGSYYERMAAQRGFNNDEEIAHPTYRASHRPKHRSSSRRSLLFRCPGLIALGLWISMVTETLTW